jgi:release factor glutamine methyltransferase
MHGIENMEFELRQMFKSTDDEAKIESFIDRRVSGEPLQYILGEWEFYGLPFKVGEGVLIPRQDTETVVDFILEKHLITPFDSSLSDYDNLTKFAAGGMPSYRILDLCAGSGCIGIALEKESETEFLSDAGYAMQNAFGRAAVELPGFTPEVVAVEKFNIRYLKENIALNSSRAAVLQADVLSEDTVNALIQEYGLFDMIVCNPPYLSKEDMENLQTEVTYEPREALYGGEDGLDFYKKLTRLWHRALRKHGSIFYELGINQYDRVKYILESGGFNRIDFKKDCCGVIRVIEGVRI